MIAGEQKAPGLPHLYAPTRARPGRWPKSSPEPVLAENGGLARSRPEGGSLQRSCGCTLLCVAGTCTQRACRVVRRRLGW